jgi:type IV secretory pathway component VirB8
MLNNYFLLFKSYFLAEQVSILTILLVASILFIILVLIGIRIFFKLKAKNGYLSEINNLQSKEDNKTYKNFIEGHLYDSF